MERILKIDRDLNRVYRSFQEIACTLSFEPMGPFHKINLKRYEKAPGIYLIELKVPPRSGTLSRWLERFRADFGNPAHLKSWIPTPKEARIRAHKELQPWMPIYVGKAKRLGARLAQHRHLPLDAPTTSLKLVERELWGGYIYNVKMIPLAGVTNYDLIAPRLESAIRNHLNPLLGRQ